MNAPADDAANRPLAAVRDALSEPRTWSLAELAREAELPVDDLRRVFDSTRRLRDAYGERDLEYARHVAALRRYYPVEVLERAGRVRARNLTSIVVNEITTVRDTVLAPLLEADADVEHLADALVESAQELLPLVGRLMELDYVDILLQLLDTEVVDHASRTATQEHTLGVGFVDLVGFTRLSASADPTGLGRVLSRFEDLVAELAGREEDVLVVKFIGDAAMLLSSDLDQLARALYAIVTARDPDLDDAARRAGLGYGPVLVREGDYFGDTVNLAARLTDLARPHSLVAGPAVGEQLGADGWQHSSLPPVDLRGIGTTRPVRLRWRG